MIDLTGLLQELLKENGLDHASDEELNYFLNDGATPFDKLTDALIEKELQ